MIHHGDCLEVMATMPAESVDAIVTDPPYGLSFMGKAWDHGVPAGPFWAEMLRVAKPGAYLLAFGGTRTVHRIATNIEDAGWIIRDTLVWCYASGFPKGRANLKPAWEPIVMARKPGPLRHLNIDECRIAMAPYSYPTGPKGNVDPTSIALPRIETPVEGHPSGRWPSNVLLSDPELFDEPNPWVVGSGATATSGSRTGEYDGSGSWSGPFGAVDRDIEGDSGGYSRFFIIPKADRADREPMLRVGVSTNAVYCNCKTVKPERWESQDRKQPEQTATTSPARAISEATTKAALDSSMTLFGSSTSAPSPQDSKSTISTGTSSTTGSKTSSPSIPSPTSDSTPDASSSTASGGSGALSAPSTDRSTKSSGTSRRKAGRSTVDADPAISPESSATSNCESCGKPKRVDPAVAFGNRVCVNCGKSQFDGRRPDPCCESPEYVTGQTGKGGDASGRARANVHPTLAVKPTDLMRHLVRLVAPPGGTVLDPFLGSGTTAIACELEGFPWIGIEKEAEYVAIAEARLNGVQRGLGLDVPAPTKAPPKTHPDLSKHQPKRRAASENYTGGWVGTEEPDAA